MNGKLRRDRILEIIRKQGFTTVSFLCDSLHYSSATINRDLNLLEGQQLIKRSYGGAEILESKSIPFTYRYNKEKKEKRLVAKMAASLVEDGETIFIDATTTTQYMMYYLTEKKNIRVITPNIAIVSFLSEYNIEVICLGGTVVEAPNILGGEDAVLAASRYRADKCFIATCSVLDDGMIGTRNGILLQKTIMANSKKAYYLADHAKLNHNFNQLVCDLNDFAAVITDFEFPKETKEKFKQTEFIYVEK